VPKTIDYFFSNGSLWSYIGFDTSSATQGL